MHAVPASAPDGKEAVDNQFSSPDVSVALDLESELVAVVDLVP